MPNSNEEEADEVGDIIIDPHEQKVKRMQTRNVIVSNNSASSENLVQSMIYMIPSIKREISSAHKQRRGEFTEIKAQINIDLKALQSSRTSSAFKNSIESISSRRAEVKISKKFKAETDMRKKLLEQNIGSAEFNTLQQHYHETIEAEKLKREELKNLTIELSLIKSQSEQCVDLEAIQKFKDCVFNGNYRQAYKIPPAEDASNTNLDFNQDDDPDIKHYLPMAKFLLKKREEQKKKDQLQMQKTRLSSFFARQMALKYNQAIEDKFKAEEQRVKEKL